MLLRKRQELVDWRRWPACVHPPNSPCPLPPAQSHILGVNLTLLPTEQCSERLIQQQVAAIQSYSGQLASAWGGGLTIHIVSNEAPLPVTNTSNGAQGNR